MAPREKTGKNELDPSKRRRGRPEKSSTAGTRCRVTVNLPIADLPLFQQWADQQKLELATLFARTVRIALAQAIATGEVVVEQPKATGDRAIAFVRALARGETVGILDLQRLADELGVPSAQLAQKLYSEKTHDHNPT